LSLAGCSENRPGRRPGRCSRSAAIAFNDSVGDNDTLFIKVQYAFTTTCEKNAKFEIARSRARRTTTVDPVAVYAATRPAPASTAPTSPTLRVTDLGDGPRQFVVTGSNQSIDRERRGQQQRRCSCASPGIAFRSPVQDKDSGLGDPEAQRRDPPTDRQFHARRGGRGASTAASSTSSPVTATISST
jgi:hypothetical protein